MFFPPPPPISAKMVSKTFALCAAALTQFHSALAVPVGNELVLPILKRDNVTVPAPKNVTPIITEIPEMTEQELQDLIEEIENGFGKLVSRTVDSEPAPRAVNLAARAQSTDGALLTFIDGETLPGTDTSCPDFELNGPFTSFQALMGSSNFRGVTVASISGNTTNIQAGDTLVDAGEFKFAENERITVFSVGRLSPSTNVAAIKFETDAGNTYEASSTIIADGSSTPEWEDFNVGSGVLARIRGTSCDSLGIFGSIGFDFIDTIESVGITHITYEGFTNNIMPTGAGTQMSVGSQILDNRNSSEKQTITLATTDAVTRQSVVTTDLFVTAGGKVAVEAGVGIPLVSEGKVTTEASWSIQTNTVSFAFFPKTSPSSLVLSSTLSLISHCFRNRVHKRCPTPSPPVLPPSRSSAPLASSARPGPFSLSTRWTST